jgi:VanZ family protein
MVEEEKLARISEDNSFRFKSRLWRYGPPVVWAALIFIGSSNLLSASHTSAFLVRPLHYLFPGASDATLGAIHFAIRKGGHLTEYFILAVLAARAFRTSSREFLRTRWFLVTLVMIIAYSLFDEFRQSFVPTRTASIFDSMIDSVGGLIGLLTIGWLRRRRNPNKATSTGSA